MTPEKAQCLKACIQEIAAILYEETNSLKCLNCPCIFIKNLTY